jgi:hypothetical protein
MVMIPLPAKKLQRLLKKLQPAAPGENSLPVSPLYFSACFPLASPHNANRVKKLRGRMKGAVERVGMMGRLSQGGICVSTASWPSRPALLKLSLKGIKL